MQVSELPPVIFGDAFCQQLKVFCDRRFRMIPLQRVLQACVIRFLQILHGCDFILKALLYFIQTNCAFGLLYLARQLATYRVQFAFCRL